MRLREKYRVAIKDSIIAILSITALILATTFGIIKFSIEKYNSQTILKCVEVPVVIPGTC
jgi:hypothetical protein